MATVSFGQWRGYYKSWFSLVDNNTISTSGYSGNLAGGEAWSVVQIKTSAVTGGNKLGTMTVKIGLSKYTTSPVYPTIYLSTQAYGSGTSPTSDKVIATYKPSSVSFGSSTSTTALTCTFDCSSLSATSAHTLYLWVGGGTSLFLAKANGHGVTWSISLTHTMSTKTVTYNKNGGSGSMSAVSVTYGNSHTVKENSFTPPAATNVTYTITLNPNYTNGTNTTKTVTDSTPKKFDIWRQGSTTGTARAPGDVITNITSNITLYATWVDGSLEKGTVVLGSVSRVSDTVTGYKVTFDTQGGSSINSITSTRKKNYTHDGWMTSSSGTTISYNTTSAYSFAKDTTLYAKWSITYVNNSITLPSAPSRAGYKFLGWGTSSTATTYKQPGETITPSTAIVYYAIWEAAGAVYIYIPDKGYKLAIPYVYTNSKWSQAIPYLYANDKWNLCS